MNGFGTARFKAGGSGMNIRAQLFAMQDMAYRDFQPGATPASRLGQRPVEKPQDLIVEDPEDDEEPLDSDDLIADDTEDTEE